MTIRLNTSTEGIIKQFDSDPGYPISIQTRIRAKNLWVLHTPAIPGGGGTTKGMPMGLLMALTYATTTGGGGGSPETYELSINTTGGVSRITIP